MKNLLLYAGIAFIGYAVMKGRMPTASVNSTSSIAAMPVDLSKAAGNTSSADCRTCDTVSKILGGDSVTTSAPQVDSPAADPVIGYAVHRLDFNGSRQLSY